VKSDRSASLATQTGQQAAAKGDLERKQNNIIDNIILGRSMMILLFIQNLLNTSKEQCAKKKAA
jgi:hypothetical protein